MKTEVLNELEKIWPTVNQVRAHFVAGTLRRLSSLSRRESQVSPASSLSSSITNSSPAMKRCWSASEPDPSIDRSICQDTLRPCQSCFESSSTWIMSDVFNANQERRSSDLSSVPDASKEPLSNDQLKPDSSDSEPTFGNGLSTARTSWTLGVNDFSPVVSASNEGLLTKHDRSAFDERSTQDGTEEQENNNDDDDDDDDSFEVLSFEAPPESSLYIKEFQHTTLNSQSNVCGCCNIAFDLISNLPARRCHYYGKLYCARCHVMDYAYIPAKIIKSFDMRLYPVCRRAKAILQLNFFQPVFDIQNDNEDLYKSVSLLSKIKASRMLFQQYYAYLSTCTRIEAELNEKILKEFYPRDYLYQSTHSYSINDLLSLKKILQTLNTANARARQHIFQCVICHEKGFTCEVCKNRKDILYPFYDDKIIGRCDTCLNIYHRQCWDNIDHDCPRCYRLIQRRQDHNI